MGDFRDDDEPVSIEADVPEADWIEQHQPVSDEDDDKLYSSEVRANEAGISIESDTPEADWIEQHQGVVEEPDEQRLPSSASPTVDAGELEQDWVTTYQAVGAAADNREVPTTPAARPRGGCNVLASITHAALRHARDAARQLGRPNRRRAG